MLRWEEIELPPPGPGEVRIRHTAIGLNFIDVYYRNGLYPTPLPAILGSEAVGVVEALGEGVSDVAVGQIGETIVRFVSLRGRVRSVSAGSDYELSAQALQRSSGLKADPNTLALQPAEPSYALSKTTFEATFAKDAH